MGVVTAMREIKFRGRDGDDWYYGSLFVNECGHTAICAPKSFWMKPVNAETVGQFTGLYDTDGREIYERDVLGNKYTSHYKFANAVVEWGVDGWLADCFSLREFLKLHTCIVVGNIYDNSELLPELPEEDDARD